MSRPTQRSSRSSSTPVNETHAQQRYRQDAAVLSEIGLTLACTELPNIEVRLPEQLALAAVEAWERDEPDDGSPETFEQRALHHRAGALALIGLVVGEYGRTDGEEIVVGLSPGLIGSALAAADLPSG